MSNNVQMSRASASHPYLVKAINDLPERLAPLAFSFVPSDEQITTIFVAPRQAFLGGKVGAQGIPDQAVIFTNEGAHYIQARSGSHPEGLHTFILGNDLLFVRLHLILLYGQLEVAGMVDGKLARFTLIYNAVADVLLESPRRHLLRMAWENQEVGDFGDDNEKLIYPIRKQSDKFGNGLALYGLQPGERLEGVVFQKEIWRKLFLAIEFEVRPPVLAAFTAKQLILLEEEPQKTKANYGWVFTFCPRSVLQKIEATPAKKGFLIRVALKRGPVEITLQTCLDPEASKDLLKLWEYIQ